MFRNLIKANKAVDESSETVKDEVADHVLKKRLLDAHEDVTVVAKRSKVDDVLEKSGDNDEDEPVEIHRSGIFRKS